MFDRNDNFFSSSFVMMFHLHFKKNNQFNRSKKIFLFMIYTFLSSFHLFIEIKVNLTNNVVLERK